MKGVIIAGGRGTRLRPFTEFMNKHLALCHGKLIIEYPLERVIETGIKDILIITNLEYIEIMKSVLGDGRDYSYLKKIPKIRLRYEKQEGDGTGGIAHALSYARNFVGKDKVFVALGDNISDFNFREHVESYDKNNEGSRIFIKKISEDRLKEFGVVELGGNKVISIEEKPLNPRGKHIAVGYYLFDNSVFDRIKKLKPSSRGQLEITELIETYLQEGRLYASELKGFWLDVGTHDNLTLASYFMGKKAGLKFENI